MRCVVLRRKNVLEAIRLAHNSAPGPDGIPYVVWRVMGVGAADILYDAALALGQNDGLEAMARDRPSFNASLGFLAEETD